MPIGFSFLEKKIDRKYNCFAAIDKCSTFTYLQLNHLEHLGTNVNAE